MGNEYAEDVQRVNGIYSPFIVGSDVFTRRVKWEKIAKRADAPAEADFHGGSAAPWSSVNNCTGPQRRRLELELKAKGFEGNEEEIRLLVSGCSLDAGSKMRLFYQSGRLQEDDHWRQ